MKLYGLTFTYNESTMIPYVMKYFENIGFDKLIVYDNQSSDNTVELLKKYPFVEVRTLDTGGKKSNQKIIDLKNNVWKEFKNEQNAWMFISDFDEVIYYNGDFKEYLTKLDKDGYNYLNQDMLQTVCIKFPDKNKFVHEDCDGGVFWGNSYTGGCKMALFKISSFNDIKYTPGAHRVRVILNNGISLKSLNNKDIKSFHIKYIDKEYCVNRKNIANKRRGDDDIKKGYGKQYTKSDSEFLKEFDGMLKKLIKVSDYMSGKINGSNANNTISYSQITDIKKSTITPETIYGDINIVKKKLSVRRTIKKRQIVKKW